MVSALPPWCRSESADGPTLVVAPHGGLCTRDLLAADTAGNLRGNDLHTAEVARLLAGRLDASLVVNLSVDRNELDLNRISEVAALAPWFLDLLQEHLERILARHAVAQLLIVHGWHVIQPRCDVGIGARLASAADAAAVAGRLTVSCDFLHGALERLRTGAGARGIHTTYGERWPAAHRNNVMQLFRTQGPSVPGTVAHPLRRLASDGRVQAVQLELGAPLRWDGGWRERFLDAATDAFAALAHDGMLAPGARTWSSTAPVPSAAAVAARTTSTPPRGGGPPGPPPGAGDGGLGVVVGLGPMSRDELGARLLLLTGGQRMLLFTGHERIGTCPPGTVGGLEARPCDGGLLVRFRGPVLDVPDASRYFRHEPAQLDARLVDLDLELRFAALADDAYGSVSGLVRLRDATWRLDAHGFTDPVLARPQGVVDRQLRLTAAFGADLAVTAQLADPPQRSRVHCLTPRGWGEHAASPLPALPAIQPGRLAGPFAVTTHDGPSLRCTPQSHVTVLRPAGEGAFVRITFGIARYDLGDGRVGSGFYEHGATVVAGGEEGEEP